MRSPERARLLFYLGRGITKHSSYAFARLALRGRRLDYVRALLNGRGRPFYLFCMPLKLAAGTDSLGDGLEDSFAAGVVAFF